MWTLYIIECTDGKFYTGITENLGRRLKEHKKKGSHFISYNSLRRLLYTEEFLGKIEAQQRESQIKRWSKSKKWSLIEKEFGQLQELSKSRDL